MLDANRSDASRTDATTVDAARDAIVPETSRGPSPPTDARLEVWAADIAFRPDTQGAHDARPIPPDPTPLACDAAFVLTVHFQRGQLTIERVSRVAFPKKSALPRHFGRFAAELYVGPTLLERARFDFPLIQDDDAEGEAYAKGLDVRVLVRVPESDRPTRLEIWDRATDRRWTFAYPPTT
ncbi:MAG: hypothetical protein NVS3B20_03390 [Polyangiales bacterium]